MQSQRNMKKSEDFLVASYRVHHSFSLLPNNIQQQQQKKDLSRMSICLQHAF